MSVVSGSEEVTCISLFLVLETPLLIINIFIKAKRRRNKKSERDIGKFDQKL